VYQITGYFCNTTEGSGQAVICRLLKGLRYGPRVITTDGLPSYGAAWWEVLPSVEHGQHRYLHNRAENSHRPTRQRERTMRRCKSVGHAQRFLSAHGPILSYCRPRRHRLRARDCRQEMAYRWQIWRGLTATERGIRETLVARHTLCPLDRLGIGSFNSPQAPTPRPVSSQSEHALVVRRTHRSFRR
jgi:DDE domain